MLGDTNDVSYECSTKLLRQTALLTGALALLASSLVVPARAARLPWISGCWTQTSPWPRAQTPPGKEWGTRTWCFKRHGVMERFHTACDRGGCDGWQQDGRYHWRRPIISFSDVDTFDDGKRRASPWRRCPAKFLAPNRMVLENCYGPSTPWSRGPYLGSKRSAE
ncbi:MULTISPECIES: hypothetical protein [unclassified Bradyrhizobium]|uniref:hypothetical protein n=1 Tax=unclassified Bradyrhizobium TaxID=2631580 RepID=UPI000688F947|nr:MULTISPECIES: hypothetical protein [unclassified Bradyrhizobium]MCP3464024.1 hypothetical protein [Bradyrhizobium sp. CCGUVB23]